MNQEQFGQYWDQLKAPLKSKWDKITAEDLIEIQGDLGKFGLVLEKRYGEEKRYGALQKENVSTWVEHRLQMLVALVA